MTDIWRVQIEASVDSALSLIRQSVVHGDDAARDGLFSPSSVDETPVSAEIPRDDASYLCMSGNLIPHIHIPNMFLLEFRTFQGARAFQPCSLDIDLLGVFKPLHPYDKVDPIFKAARDWACIHQGIRRLPKDIRWVLSIVYNLATEMLRPDVNETQVWEMRPWLQYWYDVSDRLFGLHGIMATAPDPDWFMRPGTALRYEAELDEKPLDTSIAATDLMLTPRGRSPNQNVEFVPLPPHLIARLESQPDLDLSDGATVYFDPAPGGRVFRHNRQPRGQGIGSSSHTATSSFDPLAKEFVPARVTLVAKHGHAIKDCLCDSEDLFDSCSDVSSDDYEDEERVDQLSDLCQRFRRLSV